MNEFGRKFLLNVFVLLANLSLFLRYPSYDFIVYKYN